MTANSPSRAERPRVALRPMAAPRTPCPGPPVARVSTAALMRTPRSGIGRLRRRRSGAAASDAATAASADVRRGGLLRHRHVRRQVVRGAQERRLVGLLDGDLGHDPPAEHDDRPVAGELDLLELRGVEEDRGPAGGQLADAARRSAAWCRCRCRASGRSRASSGRRRPPSGRSSPSAGCRRTGWRTSEAARVSIWSWSTAAVDAVAAPSSSRSGPRSGTRPR